MKHFLSFFAITILFISDCYGQADVGIAEIIQPQTSSVVKTGIKNKVVFVVENFGSTTVPAFTEIPLILIAAGVESSDVSLWPNSPMLPNQKDTISFSFQIPSSVSPGYSDLCLLTKRANDPNRTNDTFCVWVNYQKSASDLVVEEIVIPSQYFPIQKDQEFKVLVMFKNIGADTLKDEFFDLKLNYTNKPLKEVTKFITKELKPFEIDTAVVTDKYSASADLSDTVEICATINWEADIDINNNSGCKKYYMLSSQINEISLKEKITIHPNPARNNFIYVDADLDVEESFNASVILPDGRITSTTVVTLGKGKTKLELPFLANKPLVFLRLENERKLFVFKLMLVN